MIVEKAFLDMYPEWKLGKYKFSIKYSGKFKGFNANVTKRWNEISFSLSKNWKSINDDVKMGLVQGLFNKILKTKINTQNMELYEIFLKKVHVAVKKVGGDEILEESFHRVNEEYFYGLIDETNLKWGKDAIRTLGSYDYGADTITISKIFKDAPLILLDYVMYHEMLHKKHKFYTKNGKSFHHTHAFRKQEKRFKNSKLIERELNAFLRGKR